MNRTQFKISDRQQCRKALIDIAMYGFFVAPGMLHEQTASGFSVLHPTYASPSFGVGRVDTKFRLDHIQAVAPFAGRFPNWFVRMYN